jgi:cyclopropane-fatty-acyl-phospholipid synthase
MKGAGYYDRHSTAQQSAIRALQDWVDAAVADVLLPARDEPVAVLDLGSSEGGNASRLMASIVAGLRRRTDQPLRTIYSDLPSNDFNRLFANLDEVRGAGLVVADVYPEAVGGSFYAPLLPLGTVHLATAFNAIHWLDSLPSAPLPDGVAYRQPHLTRPALAAPSEIAAAFARQAEQDLTRFLECRARELGPGAKLLLAGPSHSDGILLRPRAHRSLRRRVPRLSRLWPPGTGGVRALGVSLLFPHGRGDAGAAGTRELPRARRVHLDRAEARDVPPPFLVEFRCSGDAAAYAAACTGFWRAVTESVVRAALRRPEGASDAVENLYERIRDRLLADPARYPWSYMVVAALLTRR